MEQNLNLALNPALEDIFGPYLFCFPGFVLDESSQLEEIDPLEDLCFDHYPAQQNEPPLGLDPASFQRERCDKVAIPRTRQIKSWSSRSRVSLACNSCRTTKAKCSGHRPVCDRCERLGVECTYGERKRQTPAKMVEELKSHIDELEDLLGEIYPTLDVGSAHLVDQSTMKFATNYQLKLARATSSVTYNAYECPLATLGYIQEDFNIQRGPQAPGFTGEFSAVVWLNRLKLMLEQDHIVPSGSQQDMDGRPPVSSFDYYQISSRMAIRENVDILKRPERVLADHLIRTYFRVVHPFFPIIGKTTFLSQYHLFYSDSTVRPGDQWLAVFNFICAIAHIHTPPTQEAISYREHVHIIHFSRGWMLSMDKTSLRHHENLQQVQIEGLAAFYLLSVGQVNRSWKCCHVAISSALAMGLNLRNESTAIAPLSKEIRYRVWWSLYVLDISLCGVTGRPMAISGRFCTTPLPSPFEEKGFCTVPIPVSTEDNMAQSYLEEELPEQPHPNTSIESRFDKKSEHSPSTTRSLCKDETSSFRPDNAPESDSSCFVYIATLSTILQDVMEDIYAPSAAQIEWAQIKLRINSSLRKVDNWLLSLPLSYGLRDTDRTRPLKCQSTRLSLQLCYTRIMITQPYFRRHMPTSSEVSDCLEFSYDPIAETCIQNASQLLDLLPNEPSLPWLFGVCPCWSALHYIMQTIVMFLTASFLQSKFSTSSPITMVENLVKASMWLKELSKVNNSAHKAWTITSDIIACHSAQLGFSSWPLPGASF
ncbi:uncharacterized protein N7469_002017 [Penicillium citrinum]|uniref:Zn(2)-C6 fungal-type domain-containing protein n=1 Tax=Penicillium citrinum TaxID=5077 RepID=A0A9W9TT60_PENCI|nr:uncharacterized protein N7469_002017 [Penicillium citrinum]KAJ5240426.1 hypothetical protein N7469_002017 [Penicillium citrinum]